MSTPDPEETEREALRTAVLSAFHDDVLICTRVWEAWGYGTMTADDFTPAIESDEFIDSLMDAVLAARHRSLPEAHREWGVLCEGFDPFWYPTEAEARSVFAPEVGDVLVTRTPAGEWTKEADRG